MKIYLLFIVSATIILSGCTRNKIQSPCIKSNQNPWSKQQFNDDPLKFQFAILPDRTGRERSGIFESAIEKINLLQPDFVISIGDLIEGYGKDANAIEAEWDFIQSYTDSLDMRFYYLSGNHDINNDLTRKAWIKRFGRTYYHFIYKNVLFLCLDGSGLIHDDQIKFFENVLKQNDNARWTFVFIHKPRWLRSDSNDWKKFESLIIDRRNYTVFAGHVHEYSKAIRNNMGYYILATAGGKSALAGPEFGQFDHLTWVTMTDKGPIITNLALNGILSDDPVIEQKNNEVMKNAQ
ncbi:MAG: hypothetical protein A2Y12_15670 [Planctomycetes bacterium GWF2_42_9]|nr:MAG: hypothetical protein A2Y12_15670 [Planctomycetes bacterium GWF2_42_9]